MAVDSRSVASGVRKLAHVRARGYGNRTFSGARWITPGPVQAITLYDVPDPSRSAGVTRWSPETGRVSPTPSQTLPSMTRSPRTQAIRVTNPLVFQSYFKVHWESLFGARANLKEGARVVKFQASPFAPGKAEGQALMDYNPFPSAGELYPKAL